MQLSIFRRRGRAEFDWNANSPELGAEPLLCAPTLIRLRETPACRKSGDCCPTDPGRRRGAPLLAPGPGRPGIGRGGAQTGSERDPSPHQVHHRSDDAARAAEGEKLLSIVRHLLDHRPGARGRDESGRDGTRCKSHRLLREGIAPRQAKGSGALDARPGVIPPGHAGPRSPRRRSLFYAIETGEARCLSVVA